MLPAIAVHDTNNERLRDGQTLWWTPPRSLSSSTPPSSTPPRRRAQPAPTPFLSCRDLAVFRPLQPHEGLADLEEMAVGAVDLDVLGTPCVTSAPTSMTACALSP
jgi:hypothetical protein